ncbi:YcnI family copper-binding membrane protein [Auraticoccus monumenti]|uniref:Uncharacterized protein YcnI n=1 Tax=Auraticoccus monumenti TaxID=675864 RepID=A0A1G6SEN5_9ACTN|nr:YcnI family protein [Auraticoccus monumenti]SDD15131.1 Uncharacterized protein YcnI [Auraticoccus monumenti]
MSSTTRRAGAGSLLVVAGLALWAVPALPASAHVTVTPTDAAAGTSAVLQFSFSHGCEGSPTTGLTFEVPEGVNTVSPELQPGWEVDKVMAQLEEPVTDSHGNELTERVDQVVFTAGAPVPDGYRETVTLQLTLPEDAAGTALAFPVVQTCAEDETAWVQVAADGQDPHDLDSPAPVVEVAAAGDEHGDHAGTGSDEAAAEQTDAAPTQAAATADGLGTGLGAAGLVAGLAGLATGVTALVRSSKRGA